MTLTLAPFDLTVAVEAELADFVADATTTLLDLDPALEPLAAAARDAVLGGGKRLRPLFAYWGWRAGGSREPVDTVVPALAALELLHAFALVHDDVMDASDTRRGRPTAHRFLAGRHRSVGLLGDADRFGDSSAILVGDLCLVWADQLMARSGVDCRRLADARGIYDRMRVEAIAGQFLDLLGDGARTWSVDQALRTARLKTAGYTVIRPLHFGAALAGHTEPMQAFTRYGAPVGEAFQLCDDLLGAFGDAEVTGKPVTDLAAGKATVLLQIALSRATPAQLALDSAALVRATGADAAVREMIAERVAEGCQALDLAPIDPSARAALAKLASAVAWRSA